MIDLSMPFFNELNLAYLRRRLIYWPEFKPCPFMEHPMLNLEPEEQIGWLLAGQEQITYTLTLSHAVDGDVTYVLDADCVIPISEPLRLTLVPDRVQLGPQGARTVTLSVSRYGSVHLAALDVGVTAHPEGHPWEDTVSVVTFIPPDEGK